MTTLTSSPFEPRAPSGPAVNPTPPATPVAPQGPGRLVTDAPMRMFHWLFALSFVGAYISADSEDWQWVHVVLGYTLAGLMAFRIVYGLVGPRPARFSTMWRKVNGTKAWLQTIQTAWGPGGNWQAVAWRQAPILLMAIRVSKNAIDGLDWSVSLDKIVTLMAINVIVAVTAYILFPYLWRS